MVYTGDGHSRAVVTSHPVERGVIGVGQPVDLVAYLRTLTSEGKGGPADIRWTSDRTLAFGPSWVCWHRPAGVTSVFINGKKRQSWLPHLIFVASPNAKQRRVWACEKLSGRSTQLYLTHLSNTYDDGGICWGSSKVPASLDPAAWEDAFFASSFSRGDKLCSTKPYALKKHTKIGPLGAALEALR